VRPRLAQPSKLCYNDCMSNALTLPPDLAAKVQAHVDSGAAADAVEVVRAGLAALEASEAAKLETVRAKLSASLADPREAAPMDDVIERVNSLIDRA